MKVIVEILLVLTVCQNVSSGPVSTLRKVFTGCFRGSPTYECPTESHTFPALEGEIHEKHEIVDQNVPRHDKQIKINSRIVLMDHKIVKDMKLYNEIKKKSKEDRDDNYVGNTELAENVVNIFQKKLAERAERGYRLEEMDDRNGKNIELTQDVINNLKKNLAERAERGDAVEAMDHKNGRNRKLADVINNLQKNQAGKK